MSTGLAANEVERFMAALKGFVDGCQGITDAYMSKHYPDLPATTISIEDTRFAPFAKTWVRLIREHMGSRSVHAFVHVPSGGIYYPAGFKAPFIPKAGLAAGARGSIYEPAGWAKCVGEYGVRTIR